MLHLPSNCCDVAEVKTPSIKSSEVKLSSSSPLQPINKILKIRRPNAKNFLCILLNSSFRKDILFSFAKIIISFEHERQNRFVIEYKANHRNDIYINIGS